MSIFDPRPSYRVALPHENARLALDMPLTPLNSLATQFQRGVMDSFGLGTAIKDFSTPRGVETGPSLGERVAGVPVVGPVLSPIIEGYDAARGLLGAQDSGDALPEDEWKASEFYRKGIPYDAGMTVDRASALAAQFDVRQAREYFGAKDLTMTILGGFAGGALDPINYVPVFGPAARAAAVGRFGYITGHGLLGASEAAINTAVFGALTTPFRGRLGEDVSWEAAINNVAFSAVAGAVFGGIGGVISRSGSMRAAVAERNARASLETVKSLQDSRQVLNDAVTSLIDTGDVKLSPTSKSVLERIAGEAVDRRVAARALETETAGVTGTKAGEVAISPSGARVAVRAEVVEWSTLQKASGVLQVRDRSAQNAVSNAQIQEIAANLDAARLMPNVDASQGAPIVGLDNIVDSGNGRVAGIGLAYDAHPEKAAAYRQALIDAGHPEAAQMERPVLISRRLTELSTDARAQFNADVNGPTTARMSAVELAAMDRAAITDDALDQYVPGQPITAAANRAFVQRFALGLPANERGAILDRNGNLSADGVRRIENAIVAAAYGDVDAVALRKFAEATDDNTRTIVGALADVAGKWTMLRRSIGRGETSADYEMTPELMGALRALSGWREQAAREGRPVSIVIKEGMAQGDMLAGDMPAATKLFVRSFYASGDFTKAAGRDTIAARLNDLADASLELGRPSLFGDAYAATKLGVLQRVYNDVETDFLEAASLRTGTDEIGGAGRGSRTGPGGEGGTRGIGTGRGFRYPAATPAERATALRRLKDAQPARTVDELYAVADGHQSALDDVGRAVSGQPARLDTTLVDAKGEALTLYHGTPGAAFDVFDAGKVGSTDSGFTGAGIYFSTDRAYANEYAGENGSVVEAKLAVKNPFVWDLSTPELQADTFARARAFFPEFKGQFAADSDAATRFTKALREAGYDAVIEETKGVPDSARSVMVLDTSQIQMAPKKKAARIEWINPGLKKRGEAEAKVARKGYESTRELTDVVRGGFTVKTPGDAETIVAALEARWPILDEGWNVTQAGYFDRKVLVQFPDGTIGEVQIWHPDMAKAKKAGHALYEQMRGLKPDDPKFLELLDAQKALYLETVEKASDDWLPVISRLIDEMPDGKPASGKASSNAAGDSLMPESMISAASASRQSPPDAGRNQAAAPDMTAGRPSQSNSDVSITKSIRTEADAVKALMAAGYDLRAIKAAGGDVDAIMQMAPPREAARALDVQEAQSARSRATDMAALESAPNAWGPKSKYFDDLPPDQSVVPFGLGEAMTLADRDARLAELNTIAEKYEAARNGEPTQESMDAIGFVRSRPLAPQGTSEPTLFPTVDMQEPRPEPPPDGLDAAAARVGQSEDVKALAEQFGVDENGGYAEQVDIDALREAGRLSEEDEAALQAADQLYADAEAYAETLRVAAACVMG